MRDVFVALKLEVIGQDVIIVPGCEPTSALSSDTLARFNTCTSATVKLADALAAIPGSSVQFQINNGESNGGRKKWFVLPEHNFTCPCEDYPDYYRILRELSPEEEKEVDFTGCEVLDQGFCPPKNFNQPPPPAVYKEEGDTLGGITGLFHSPNIFDQPAMVDPIVEG
jgi:hypothetical protein